MASTITNTVDSYIRNTGITGNTMLDTMIYASLVPLILTYINWFMEMIKLVGGNIASYIINKIKARFVGKILCSISINQDNRLFKIIKETAFDINNPSDVSSYIMGRISNIKPGEKSNDKYEFSTKWFNYDKFDITLDYSGNKLFRMSKNYSSVDIDTKAFTYNEYYVKFTLQYDSMKDKINNSKDSNGSNNSSNSNLGNIIMIDLITMNNINNSKTNEYKYANIIEKFLKEKFRINEHITYHYSLNIADKTLQNSIFTFIDLGWKKSSIGLLGYGNGQFELLKNDTDVKTLANKLYVSLTTQNINTIDEDNLDKQIMLIGKNMDASNIEKTGFMAIYDRFIGKGLPDKLSTYSYYINDNKIIMLWLDIANNCYIDIISAGKLLNENDIKQVLKFIVKNGHTTKKINVSDTEKKQVYVYKLRERCWNKYQLDKRSFDSIFINENTMMMIKKEIENFIRVEKLYNLCSIPYRKGILFYGPPGTGKSSLVKAIAYEYQLNVYMININDKDINDDTITDILNSIGGGSNKILLFEDIDSAFADKEIVKNSEKTDHVIQSTQTIDAKLQQQNEQKENINRKYLTYSGLINALDGVLSNHHGVITIMTTNYLDKLGEALIRPGRIDHKYMLGPCDYEQICNMTSYIITTSIRLIKSNELENIEINLEGFDINNLHDKIKEFSLKLVDENKKSIIKPCKLQQYILKYIENINNIFNNYHELLE